MKDLEEKIDAIVIFLNRLVGLIFKFVLESAPAIFILFIIISVMAKGFRVIILGETP